MYYPRLDGIRFIAIMMVIFIHFATSLAKHFKTGFYGVNLFFVLSGFLITGILISSKEDNFKKAYAKFVARRALRIFPAYYLMILILILLKSDLIFQDLPYLLSYTYNYIIDDTRKLPGHAHFWSLAVEEQFYLFFPLVVLLLRKNRSYLIVAFLLLITIAYAQVFFNIWGLKKYDYVGLVSNMGPLTIGAMGALVNKESKYIKWFFKNLYFEIISFVVLILVLYNKDFKLMILMCSVINLILVLKASKFEFLIKPINQFLQIRVVTYIGRVSYGIYLYHGIVGNVVSAKIVEPFWNVIPFNKWQYFSFIQYGDWLFRVILITIVSTFVAGFSFRYFESFFLRFKDIYFKN